MCMEVRRLANLDPAEKIKHTLLSSTLKTQDFMSTAVSWLKLYLFRRFVPEPAFVVVFILVMVPHILLERSDSFF